MYPPCPQQSPAMALTDSNHQRQSRRPASPDYLTCGDCDREFLLENITLFIAHKKWGCSDKPCSGGSPSSSDPGEDTSSPLTCSVCSRVFVTARGLLQHVQREHKMNICLAKGPLILPSKSFRSQSSLSSSCPPPRTRTPLSASSKSPFYAGAAYDDTGSHSGFEDRQMDHVEDPLTVPHDRQSSSNDDNSVSEMRRMSEAQSEQQQQQQISEPEYDDGVAGAGTTHPDEPEDLSRRPRSRGERLRSESEGARSPRSPTFRSSRQDAAMSATQRGQSVEDPSRLVRSSSASKKRRMTPPLPQLEPLSREGMAGHAPPAKLGYASKIVSPLNSSDGSEHIRSDCYNTLGTSFNGDMTRQEAEEMSDTTDAVAGRANGARSIKDDYSPYQAEDENSPICLVVTDAKEVEGQSYDSRQLDDVEKSDAAGANSEHTKNVKLKQLLARQEYPLRDALAAQHPDDFDGHTHHPEMINGHEDRENMGNGGVDEAYGQHFSSENQDHPQDQLIQKMGASIAGSCLQESSHVSQQQRLSSSKPQRVYPKYGDFSIKQSIDEIIRDQMMDDRDSLERTPPRPASSCSGYGPVSRLPQPLSVAVTTANYQSLPLPIPPLINPSQLGYFPRQAYGPLSPLPGNLRAAAAGPHSYNTSPVAGRGAGDTTKTGKMRDLSPGAYESGSLFTPAAHDGSAAAVSRFPLGYHHKSDVAASMARGAGDYKSLHRQDFYRREMELQHWTGYGSALVGRLASKSSDYPINGAELEEGKDGRMKKRRYPTSRPFKCPHCDQAFNQRIHLKKHMSKHTGVKPFKCQQCDYSTVERSHLKVHYRIHTGEKPYRCMFCDYATAQNSTLKIHLRRHHEGQQQQNGSARRENNTSSNNGSQSRKQATPQPSRPHVTSEDSRLYEAQRHQQWEDTARTSAGRHRSQQPHQETVIKQEPREADHDLAEQFHAYLNRTPADGSAHIGSPGSHQALSSSRILPTPTPGPGSSQTYFSQKDAHGSVWPETMVSRHQGSVSKWAAPSTPMTELAGEDTVCSSTSSLAASVACSAPIFPRNVYLEKSASSASIPPPSTPPSAAAAINNGADAPVDASEVVSQEEKVSPQDLSGKQQQQPKEEVEEEVSSKAPKVQVTTQEQCLDMRVTKVSSATPVEKNSYTTPIGAVGLGQSPHQVDKKLVAGKMDSARLEVISEDDDDDSDLQWDEDLPSITIPDKAFVRG